MSTADQIHLLRLAAEAEAAQQSRQRQRELERAAVEEQQQRLAVARIAEKFANVFGPRFATSLNITFQRRPGRPPVATLPIDGRVIWMYFENTSFYIQEGDRPRWTVGSLSTSNASEPEAAADQQRDRCEKVIVELAKMLREDADAPA